MELNGERTADLRVLLAELGQASLDVFQGQVFQLPDQDAEMRAHRTEHAQGEFYIPMATTEGTPPCSRACAVPV